MALVFFFDRLCKIITSVLRCCIGYSTLHVQLHFLLKNQFLFSANFFLNVCDCWSDYKSIKNLVYLVVHFTSNFERK